MRRRVVVTGLGCVSPVGNSVAESWANLLEGKPICRDVEDTAPNFGKDFVRNGLRLDQPVLYARGDAPDALRRACTLYPGAAVYAFHLDRERPEGWLEPLACPAEAH